MAAAIEVDTGTRCSVRVGPGLLAEAGSTLGAVRRILVADARVLELYGARLDDLERTTEIAVGPGEGAKRLSVLERVLEAMAAAGLDRESEVVAFGGGAVCDLGGLAASLWMRGVPVVLLPTTLLAQVDASIGGKTAVNLDAGKNLAGTFWQPRTVLADTATSQTLPEEELRSGLGEVAKTALVEGEELLSLVEAAADALVARDGGALEEVVAACVRAKARMVATDPHERGPRVHLNLGHTFAHAIEHVAGYGRVPHGVAVAAGLGLALEASRAMGLLEDPGLSDRVTVLLGRLGLPASLAELRRKTGLDLPAPALARAMRVDKKGAAGVPRFVLPRRAGHLARGVILPGDLLDSMIRCRTP